MATGDDALAAGMDLVLGTALANTLDTEENKTRDYIAQRTSAVQPIAKGGTGSTSAAAARSALGITPANISAWGNSGAGTPTLGWNDARLLYEVPGFAYPTELANKSDVDYQSGRVDYLDTTKAADNNTVHRTGDTMSGHLYLPNSVAATSGFTVCYINVDGRVSKGSSSIRYKNLLADPDLTTLQGIFPTLRTYAMKADEAQKPTLGYIAEELAANPETERFVVYQWAEGSDGTWAPTDVPESIDFVQLLLAQVASLNARLAAMESTFNPVVPEEEV